MKSAANRLKFENVVLCVLLLLQHVELASCEIQKQNTVDEPSRTKVLLTHVRHLQSPSSSPTPLTYTLFARFRRWIQKILERQQNPIETTPKPARSPVVSKPPTQSDNTNSPVAPPSPVQPPVIASTAKCKCDSCDNQAWNTKAGQYTCGERITYLQTTSTQLYPSEEAACLRIGNVEFPLECQPCNPVTCNDPTAPSYYCSCPSCTASIWSTIADEHTCGSRIQWIQTQEGLTEESACRRVSNEFPSICGPSCNPDVCSTVPVVPISPITPPPPVPSSPPAPYTGDTNLYCYPDVNARKRYTNVWKKYIVEVKESMEICGPGSNKFSRQTVALSSDKDELTLQYKQVSGTWTGSEVRVVLPPEQMPFTYGSFSFSVKSITVRNRLTNVVSTSNDLPPSLILGLFTWDPSEDYSSHENFNHEVDIEISRWNDTSASDAQFLVQPPGSPQMKRFYTGVSQQSGQRSPGGHTYQFTWNPGEVFWYTTAGGGQSHSYSTLQTITENVPDYVQCLPSNTEVRMNLWNMDGAIQTPTNLGQNDVVEVIIDKFSFIPSGLDGLKNNKKCTKDCQCKKPSKCINKVCTATL